MGTIYGRLKCLFIFFNVLFAIIGCLMIYGLTYVSDSSHQLPAVGNPGLVCLWALFSISILGISCLGIFAACSEIETPLKIFAGFMAAGMIIMLIFGIVYTVKRNQFKNIFDSASIKYTKAFMEDENTTMLLEGLQTSAECCGVVKAEDWRQEIPDSCACKSAGYGGSTCKARPRGTTGPDQIYAQSCIGFIFQYIDGMFKALMGYCFGFSITAAKFPDTTMQDVRPTRRKKCNNISYAKYLLGLLVSLFMIHHIRHPDSTEESSMAMHGY